MTDNYDLQFAMNEKRVTDKPNPLTVNKTRYALNSIFKRLTKSIMKRVEMIIIRSLNCLVVNLKENIKIVV
jgi:hypothetical protein